MRSTLTLLIAAAAAVLSLAKSAGADSVMTAAGASSIELASGVHSAELSPAMALGSNPSPGIQYKLRSKLYSDEERDARHMW